MTAAMASILALLPKPPLVEIRLVRITVRCKYCLHDWTVALAPDALSREPYFPAREWICLACGGKP